MIQIRCYEPTQAHRAMMQQVWPQLKAQVTAGHCMILSLNPETRSLKENALLHALLTQISRQKEWGGALRSVECWKRLIVASWCRARGEHIEMSSTGRPRH